MGSVVAVYGLSCPMECGILVPSPGIEALSPALQGWILNQWITREVSVCIFNRVVYMAFSWPANIVQRLERRRKSTMEQVFRSRTFQDMGERMNYSIYDFGINEYLFEIYT